MSKAFDVEAKYWRQNTDGDMLLPTLLATPALQGPIVKHESEGIHCRGKPTIHYLAIRQIFKAFLCCAFIWCGDISMNSCLAWSVNNAKCRELVKFCTGVLNVWQKNDFDLWQFMLSCLDIAKETVMAFWLKSYILTWCLYALLPNHCHNRINPNLKMISSRLRQNIVVIRRHAAW